MTVLGLTSAGLVPSRPEVRVARDDDVAQAGALTAEAYHADRLLEDDDEYEAELRDAGRRAQEATVLVAAVPRAGGADGPADVVVGTLTLAPAGSSYAEIADEGEIELRMLAVAPEARNRGVAELLVLGALREAVGRGADRVVLSTLDAMAAARRLYARLGFVASPERDWSHEEVVLRVLVWEPPEPPGVLVESATWVPFRTQDVDGWRVGLTGGLTRRANSVLPLGEPADLTTALDEVEAVYGAQGQPAVFRVCPAALPHDLDDVLARRGYALAATTDVLVRAVAAADGSGGSAAVPGLPGVTVALADEPDDAWMSGWLDVKASGAAVDTTVARTLVSGSPALYLTADDADGVVGVLRAAFAGDWVGLSCLMVAPRARRRGIARLLTQLALREAGERGVEQAFLQVEASNAGAVALYESMGFRPAQRYHYRQR